MAYETGKRYTELKEERTEKLFGNYCCCSHYDVVLGPTSIWNYSFACIRGRTKCGCG